MSQKRTDKNRKSGNRTPPTTGSRHLSSVQGPDDAGETEDQPLLQGLRDALAHPHPLGLLTAVSTLMTVTDSRTPDPFDRSGEDEPPGLDVLVESFVEVDLPETAAAAAAIAAMTGDDMLRVRVRRALAGRRRHLPGWLDGLDDTEVVRVVRLRDLLGDGDSYLLDVRLHAGGTGTMVLYVDHNLGTVVKDGFAVEGSTEDVLSTRLAPILDEDQSLTDVDLAVARAVITDAVDQGALLLPPLETETWPAVRPLLEWLLRSMPAGGRTPERPQWSEQDLQQLVEDFFESPYAGLDDDDARDLLSTFLWFGTDYGPGDPLRWSTVNVEVLLVDWLPRKVVADAEYLAKAPDLLRGFVRYCHDRRGIRHEVTMEVLGAVDKWEPDYHDAIRMHSPQDIDPLAALLAAATGRHPDRVLDEMMLENLDKAVGGRAVLMNLTEQPLPDEGFEWAGIPDDIAGRVGEVLALCGAGCEEMLDVEHRTACRRLLARATVADPAIFRRKAASRTAAAAVCWIIAKANHTITHQRATLSAKELLGWFGVVGAQRASVFLRAVGAENNSYDMGLGAADLLVSSRREEIIARRDECLARLLHADAR